MASKSSSSSSKLTVYQGEKGRNSMANLSHKLNLLKQKIQSGRLVSVGEKLKKNNKKIQAYVSDLQTLAASRTDSTDLRSNEAVTLLSSRIVNPLGKLKGIMDKDDINIEESVFSSTAKLHKLVEKMPPYTTWIFLHRNQRMTDDQSVVGRRRIYYAQHGGEALVCSDSEEDLLQLKGQKLEFSEGEDCILRTAFKEYEINDEVLDILAQYVGGTSSEIKDRCYMLMEKEHMAEKHKLKSSAEEGSEDNAFMDKSLGAAIDSFDNLFCRRCLVFDCHLHGCSQNIIYSSENQTCPTYPEDRKPCGAQCYLQLNNPEDLPQSPAVNTLDGAQSKSSKELDETNKYEVQTSTEDVLACPLNVTGIKVDTPIKDKDIENVEPSLKGASNDFVECSHGWREWKPFEKDLYMKGLEIFGRNSCFIARNLLCGLKTCKEVSNYMYGRGVMFPRGSSAILSSLCEDGRNAEMENMGPEIKSRVCRKRGRTRKLKSSWKSAGHPSLWRRIAHGKDKPYKHYVPCGCQSSCGKECPCQQTGTCCEKYCGCSKGCKNRFNGCHCAKSQCRSRQCPCFAAGRECDPDVCRNCRVGCGDGSLGEPPKRGEGQCGNMKLLLRQQQRILLASSDIAGWGAFIKNTVYKNDYLGEYTGELISHEEADRRGKIYDLSNSSFLFDLNDQYVLDAYRKGNKLKFANHSSTPNCYARVMLVSGDHRVGIFANECIEAGEELFYDYRYGPDEAPSWARKRDGPPLSHGRRAKKHQSS